MKRIIYLACFMMPLAGMAQKQGNIWYFGTRYGLDFNSGTPAIISGGMTGYTNGQLIGQEGCSAISDLNGSLLFYTDNTRIFNRNHQVMPHGDSLTGHVSSGQGSLIIPKPGSNSIFYVFTNDAHERLVPATPKRTQGFRYSVVDMCLDSNRGDVIVGQKDIRLLDSSSEKMSACRDGQEDGYWILDHKAVSNEIRAWHLTSAGISKAVVSTIAKTYEVPHLSVLGAMKFNPAGTRLVISTGDTLRSGFLMYDFNPTTGVLTNMRRAVIDSPADNTVVTGLEFSPDGSKLFATVGGTIGANSQLKAKRLFQYDLSAGGGNWSSVLGSRYTTYQAFEAANSTMGGMQAGPDGKIYLNTRLMPGRIGRINFPNLYGSAADFDSAAINLPGASPSRLIGFPVFVAGFRYNNGVPCPKPATVSHAGFNVLVELTPNPVRGSSTLHLSSLADYQNLELSLVDAFGRTLRKIRVSVPVQSIDFSDAAPGLYFYRLYQKGTLLKAGKVVVD